MLRFIQYPDIAKLGHKRFNPLDVYLSIFSTGAMTQIDGELEHRETISHNALAKQRIGFPLLFRFCRQIEKHQHPHDSIFAKAIHHFKAFRDIQSSAARLRSI